MPHSGSITVITPERSQRGLAYAIAAYALWGAVPAYFLLLAPAGATEIVAWRIMFSLVFCAILLTVTRGWPAFLAILRQPRLVLITGLAGALIYINWQVFVLAALNGQILESALGYFINPILTVLLGVVFLKERLRPAQWVAVSISAVAIVVMSVGLGVFPWISLSLALSFGLYGLIKKQAGPRIDAITGLTLETMWLVPVASVILIVVASTSGIVFGTVSGMHTTLLALAGVVTALPLLLFAAAARRLTLVTIGMVQYLTPVLSFLFAVLIMKESMPVERWIGFGLVWVALIILSADMIRQADLRRRGRRTRP